MPRHIFFAALLAATPVVAQAESIVFAWTPNPQTPQVDIALAEGMFEAVGLDVSIVSFPTGREGFEALLGGQVDITFMAELPAATGALRDQDFAIVADLARFTGSRIIGSATASEFTSAADLEGLRIGTTLGTNVHFMLSGELDATGVEATIVNASPVDLVSAITRGDVDAIAPFPTFFAAAADALGENYREVRVDSYQVHYILAARPAMLEREEVLQTFLSVLAEADMIVAAEPERAMAAVSASLGGAMSPEALGTMWQDVDIGLTLSNDLLDLLVDQSAWIVEQGVVNADAPTRDEMRAYFAPGPLQEVDASRVTLD